MNKAILIGRIVRDPEVRYTQGDKPMCIARYTLAVDRRFKRQGDATADFIPCVCFGKTAEFIEKYAKKGTKLAVSGRITTGSYTNRDGQKVYTTEVTVEEQDFAESKAAASQNTEQTTQHTSTQQTTQPNTQTGAGIDNYMNIPDGIDSDDMPFA